MAFGIRVAPGTVIAGYEIERALGRGGMGDVFLARKVGEKRVIALKLLNEDLAADTRFRARFERESDMATSLEHPHIIPVYDFGEADGVRYIAMRYVDGPTLRDLVKEGSPVEPRRCLALLDQVANALDAAHEIGLVHRDVKPANVLIARGGAGEFREHAYLTDFGISKYASSGSDFTRTGQFVGTSLYASPEQIKGEQIDGRTDVYSFGAVVFECLTGRPPYERDTDIALMWAHITDEVPCASSVNRGLPPELDAVIARAMAKPMEDRYTTCGEVVAAARAALRSGAGDAVASAGAATEAGSVTGSTPAPTVVPAAPTVVPAAPTVVPASETVIADEVADRPVEITAGGATEVAESVETVVQAAGKAIVPVDPAGGTVAAGTAPGPIQTETAMAAVGSRGVAERREPARSGRLAIAAVAALVLAATAAGGVLLLGSGGDPETVTQSVTTERLPPAVTAPARVAGVARVGSTLTASPGTWSGKPKSFSYAWSRCPGAGAAEQDGLEGCRAIAGATGRSYAVAPRDGGHRLQVTVTAASEAGRTSTTAHTAPVTVPPKVEPPRSTSPPTVSGTTRQGSKLQASSGTWAGGKPLEITRSWLRCTDASGASCEPVPGATGRTYTLGAKDVGRVIRVVETARNNAGRAQSVSTASAVISAPGGGGSGGGGSGGGGDPSPSPPTSPPDDFVPL